MYVIHMTTESRKCFVPFGAPRDVADNVKIGVLQMNESQMANEKS